MKNTYKQIASIVFFTAFLLLFAGAIFSGVGAEMGNTTNMVENTNTSDSVVFESISRMQMDQKVCGLDSVVCPSETARVTKYGWTGNTMANGKYPEVGYCATSDRSIPFGTVIIVEGIGECIVGDRTAKWVHNLHGFTVDLYSEETEAEMLNWGAKQLEIIIK